MIKIKILFFVLLAGLVLQGCMGVRTNRRSDRKADKIIDNLTLEVETLNEELEKVKKEKDSEVARLKSAQSKLLEKLQLEIEQKDAQVAMSERGLVITFLTQVFFDSGKSDIKTSGLESLKKITGTLKDLDREIRVEGHTDNVPIRHTKHLYKSNWELSSARAMSVLHFLQKHGIKPEFLSAAGYGEYRPVVPNTTKANKAKNRRVEIVILPKEIKTVKKASKTCSIAKKKSKCSYSGIK